MFVSNVSNGNTSIYCIIPNNRLAEYSLIKMELELSRVDYTLVGVTSNNCMKLLPGSGLKDPQKVAIADNDGILQVFSIKKEDVHLYFKTLPGPKITALKLGGVASTSTDKIFVASGNEVRGYTKKGKLFLSFDSNLTETIIAMYVLGNDLFLCGKHIYNHYRDCKDIGSYLCGDCIIDVVAYQSQMSQRLISLIACEGRMIRTIEHARVTSSIEVESSPTLLHIYDQDNMKHILYGTSDGRIGLLDVENTHTFKRWIINNEKNTSSISCIDSYDFTGNDIKNLIIGRSDGNIEVYSLNILDAFDTPVQIFLMNCNESVTSLQCGIVGNQNFEEILVCTYTGKIFGLTSEIIDKTLTDEFTKSNYSFSSDTSLKIGKLKTEVEELQGKVIKEREKYQTSTQTYLDEYSAIPLIMIKDTINLSKVDASYTLTIEVPAPIDNILLQSDVPIDLLDVEKNSAVVSFSESDPESGSFLLATYRCQINTNRLEVKIRTIEGQYGTLQAYITPLLQPKCCQLRQYNIKPLSLHLRVYNFDESRPLNTLRIRGSFSLAEMHSWLMQCLPEVPEKPNQSERNVLYFESTFLCTSLKCFYVKGDAEFQSDNISTISIIKNFISKEATNKNIKIEISTETNDESINHVLKLIEPKLTSRTLLSKKLKLIEALHELELNDEESMNSLSHDYKSLLNNEVQLKSEYTSQPSYLDRLFGIVTDLYVDYNKFKGLNVKSKIPQLVELLENFNYERILNLFRPNLENLK